MSGDVLLLILVFLTLGNIDLEIGKFKLKFSGIIYKIVQSLL